MCGTASTSGRVAARGGHADWIYAWAPPWDRDSLRDRANGSGVGGKDQWERTAPVGSFPPNGFKLYDMVGNVWEWTSSLFRPYPYETDDGREDPKASGFRVVRGGSWRSVAEDARASGRSRFDPLFRYYSLGFRCARDVSP